MKKLVILIKISRRILETVGLKHQLILVNCMVEFYDYYLSININNESSKHFCIFKFIAALK